MARSLVGAPSQRGRPAARALFGVERFDSFFEVFFGHFLFSNIRLLSDPIDHFVFKKRCLDLLAQFWVLLNEFKELAFLTRVLTRLVHDRLCELSVRHLDLLLLTDVGEQEAKTHTALCE